MIWLIWFGLLHATEKHPKWLDAKIEDVKASGDPVAITRWRYKGQVVYLVPKHCCDIPTEVLSVGGQRLCELGGGFSNVTTPGCEDFEKVAKRLATVWTPERPKAAAKVRK